MPDRPHDIAAFKALLSDAEVVRLTSLAWTEAATRRFAELAERFPVRDASDSQWPPDYARIDAWREAAGDAIARDAPMAAAARSFYRAAPADFIDHWCVTYDPRNAGRGSPAKMPFVLFRRQRELVRFLLDCIAAEESGLIEKSRDMGATWLCCALSVALWLFWPGAAIGWGSRKEALVDKLGDPDSIFEKMRMIVRALPRALLPRGFSEKDHMNFMKLVNPQSGATVTGEAGDNIGRGGRKLIYFKDESAHYERPETIEAALSDTSRVQIDISSVNGLGNVFHRRREAGKDWVPGEPLEPGRTAIFVLDWRDHPAKSRAWYEMRRRKAADDGLLHVFRQEIDRDYAGSVEGTIVPAEWVKSAIDAHVVLGFGDGGLWTFALDVADGGGDVNALAGRKGVVLRHAESWGEEDTGATARRAVAACEGKGALDLQYDSVGVGAGVKAETNRLTAEGLMPAGIRMAPWNAGGAVRDPDEPLIEGDRDSPLNRDMFANFKAQAWWSVRTRFEKTHRAITEGVSYDPSELISLASDLPLLRRIEKELSQPTAERRPGDMKLIVDKKPRGTRSPNIADAIVMAYNPLPGLRPVFPVAASEIEQEPFAKVPAHWKRGFGIKVEPDRVSILWGAWDADSDIVYIISEHSRSGAEPSAHAQAAIARGGWMPGFLEATGGTRDETRQTIDLYRSLGLRVDLAEPALEPGIADMRQRVATGRFKAFTTCTAFLADYRSYRRSETGEPIGSGLIDCARILCRPSALARMAVKPAAAGEARRPAHVGDRRVGY